MICHFQITQNRQSCVSKRIFFARFDTVLDNVGEEARIKTVEGSSQNTVRLARKVSSSQLMAFFTQRPHTTILPAILHKMAIVLVATGLCKNRVAVAGIPAV